jgi:hypothetical protein
VAVLEHLVGLDAVLVVGLVELEPVVVAWVLGLVRYRLAMELVGLDLLVALEMVELVRLVALVGLDRLEPLVVVGLVGLVDLQLGR